MSALLLTFVLFGEARGPDSDQAALAAAALADAHAQCAALLGEPVTTVATSATEATRERGAFDVIVTAECSAPGPATQYFPHILAAYAEAWAQNDQPRFFDVKRYARAAIEAMGPDALPLIAAARTGANPALRETLDDAAQWIRLRADLPDAPATRPAGLHFELDARSQDRADSQCARLLGAAGAAVRVGPGEPYECSAPGEAAAYAERFAALLTAGLARSEAPGDQSLYFAAKAGLRQAKDAAAPLVLALATSTDSIVAGDGVALLGALPTKTPAVIHAFAAALGSRSFWLLGAAEEAASGFAGVEPRGEIDAAIIALLAANGADERQSGISVLADSKGSSPALKEALLSLLAAATDDELDQLFQVPEALAGLRLTPADWDRVPARVRGN